MSKNTGKYNKNKLKTLQGGNHEEIKQARNLEPKNFPKNKKGECVDGQKSTKKFRLREEKRKPRCRD